MSATTQDARVVLSEETRYASGWPALPSAEELAEPIVTALCELLIWFDERASTFESIKDHWDLDGLPQDPEVVDQVHETVARPDDVRVLIRTALRRLVESDTLRTASTPRGCAGRWPGQEKNHTAAGTSSTGRELWSDSAG